MSYTVAVDGVSVHCDSAAEVLELVRLVGVRLEGIVALEPADVERESSNGKRHSTTDKPDPPEPRSTPSARVGDPKPEDWGQARTWWMEGMFVREIAERLGVTESAVYYRQRTQRWPERPAKRGVKPFADKQTPPKESKLSPAEWDLVRARYVDGREPLREIARQFGITHQTIMAHAVQDGWPPREADVSRGRPSHLPFPPPSGRPAPTRTCSNCGVGTPVDRACVHCGKAA